MKIYLKTPTLHELSIIQQFINEYELDNRNLHANEFIAATNNENIVGFGRLKKHNDCIELCSLGVIIPERRKGIGKAIVNKLVGLTTKNIYLVCIIPEYFIPLGFKIANEYPKSIQIKMDYCINDLPVPEKYVAMKLEQQFN